MMSFGMVWILIKKFDFSKVKRVFREVIIFLILLFVVTSVVSYIRQPTLDSNVLPEMEVVLLDGSIFKPEKGKPLVVHFWATWCPTCRFEASNVESVSDAYEVVTVAVNSGEDKVLQAYMQAHELTFRVINDKKSRWATQFKVSAFPTTFIYDVKGELAFTEVGYTTTAGLLARLKLAE